MKSGKSVRVACALIIFCATLAFGVYCIEGNIVSHYNTKSMRKYEHSPDVVEKGIDPYIVTTYDFKGLCRENKDIVGWIKVPGTNIDYPICRGKTPSEYLFKGADGNYDPAGAVFIQPGQDIASDTHVLFYAHNAGPKYMFGPVRNYENESFYREHRVFYIYTPFRNYRINIFSFYTAHDGSQAYQYGFSPDSPEYSSWLEDIRRNSWYDTHVKPGINRQCFTLSTCVSGDDRLERRILSGTVDETYDIITGLVSDGTVFDTCTDKQAIY